MISDRNLAESRPAFKVIALAASAGGLKILTDILSELPSDFPGAVLVLLHLDPKHSSFLASILARACTLKVKEAGQGDQILPGLILVAGPNKHMLADDSGKIALSLAAPVHHVRPSADVLFESLASAYGKRAIAVVLTGTGLDGADGVKQVKKHGGTVIIQNIQTAEFGGMPSAASNTGAVDFELGVEEITSKLLELAGKDIR